MTLRPSPESMSPASNAEFYAHRNPRMAAVAEDVQLNINISPTVAELAKLFKGGSADAAHCF